MNRYLHCKLQKKDKRAQVDVVYTDFRKAFDKVDHVLLLRKLAYNGIKGNLLRWFASYLDNRTQKITINGFESRASLVPSGVIQGSILGPLLYSLFINDINKCFLNCNFALFADDLKIYKAVNDQSDCKLIQDDLNRFHAYCLTNKLYLAYDMCVHITFTKKQI